MNVFELVKFNYQSIELDVNVSTSDRTIWLSKKQMALLFGRDRSVISRHIKNIFIEQELNEKNNVHFLHTAISDKPVLFYSIDVIIGVGNRVKSNHGLILKEWFDNYLSNYRNPNIIVYNNGSVRLDVKIEPLNETVWLSVSQMALLFDTSTDNIYFHIKNIFKEGEIVASVTENSSATQMEVFQKSTDGKQYLTKLYNLDVILAVGYRVKGKRAIEFRKWVSSVLKQYLLKGYAIDKQRTLVANENYMSLVNQVNHLKDDVQEIKEIVYTNIKNSNICYEGKYYDAFVFVNDLIRSAKQRVIIIDGYADECALRFFVGTSKDIQKIIVCHKKDRINNIILEFFVKQYGSVTIKENKSYHDRFPIIDNDIYILGASLNSLGKKTSTITKTDEYKIEDIYKDE